MCHYPSPFSFSVYAFIYIIHHTTSLNTSDCLKSFQSYSLCVHIRIKSWPLVNASAYNTHYSAKCEQARIQLVA